MQFVYYFRNPDISIGECPDGGIGRRAGLKHLCLHWHAGSTPAPGTQQGNLNFQASLYYSQFYFFSKIVFVYAFNSLAKNSIRMHQIEDVNSRFHVPCDVKH